MSAFDVKVGVVVVRLDKTTYDAVKPDGAWDYPIEELDYLLERAEDEQSKLMFALVDGRLCELE